jgi:serine/threonine protein kinase
MARESSFLYALMFRWPTSWLHAEQCLNHLARTLRDDPPEAEEEPTEVQAEADASLPFEVGKRFRIGSKAGRGASSVVRMAHDLQLDRQVAIKRVQDAAPDYLQLRLLMRELSLLRRLRGHSSLIEICDVVLRKRKRDEGSFVSGGSKTKRKVVTDVYIISEYMMSDLGRMLDHNATLTTAQVRWLMFQFLSGLDHMHESGIMHRDIKPANLLVDKMWNLKICDLGIARETRRGSSGQVVNLSAEYTAGDLKFTDYVVTRPYRSPELLMGARQYGYSVDMWSAGCILAELLAGQEPIEMAPMSRSTSNLGRIRMPLFPGRDQRDMVRLIVSVLGHPSEEELELLGRWEPKPFFVEWLVAAQPYPHCDLETKQEVYGVESVGEHCSIPTPACAEDEEACPLDPMEQQPVDWREVFPWADRDAVNLLSKLLRYDPSRRLTARQALTQPFFTKHLQHVAQVKAAASPAGATGSAADAATVLRRAVMYSARSSSQGLTFDTFWDKCDEQPESRQCDGGRVPPKTIPTSNSDSNCALSSAIL